MPGVLNVMALVARRLFGLVFGVNPEVVIFLWVERSRFAHFLIEQAGALQEELLNFNTDAIITLESITLNR